LRLTPLPREAPRPHRGAARGAAEGPPPRCRTCSIPCQFAERERGSSRGAEGLRPPAPPISHLPSARSPLRRSRGALSAIPLAVGRRSHAGGSSAPLRSAPRRGASRGWGFEGALRRTAIAPVVARTVSHASEPLHTSTTRTRVENQSTPLGHRRGNAFRRQSHLFRTGRPDPHNRPTRSSWSASPWARPAARERQHWIRADRHRGPDPPAGSLLDLSVPAVNIRMRARLPQHRRQPIIPC
jgi:hypothetical protein